MRARRRDTLSRDTTLLLPFQSCARAARSSPIPIHRRETFMFRFKPTADQADFEGVPGLPEAWHAFINAYFESNLYGSQGALPELRAWNRSDADLRFFNPASMPVPAGAQSANVFWTALPTSYDARFGGDTQKLHRFLDKPKASRERLQDEYCEWVVQRDALGRIMRIIFTSEPPDYYQFLYDGEFGVPPAKTRKLLVELYRRRCGTSKVKLADLVRDGSYDWNNAWNGSHALHMNQRNNTLGAQINIVARASILRQRGKKLITDARALIECAQYGDPERQSDPAIGAAVNQAARGNRFITLENPVGLYMTGLDTSGWTAPDGSDPQSFWNVRAGIASADPSKAMIVRAELAVPADKSYTLSDVEIGGVPIAFGAQVAAHIQVRVGVIVSPGDALPPPRPIGCTGEKPRPLEPPVKIRRRR
jgi:hypothetical protein